MTASTRRRPLRFKTHSIISGGHAYFVVQDPMAGRRHVYTVYKIALSGDKRVTIIGRELDLPVARKVIRRQEAA
jgi:hypothetical protein